MPQPDSCYKKHPEVRKEAYILLVIIVLFIPTVIGIYFFIQPRIERTYLVTISDDFQIEQFSVGYWNYTNNMTESMNFNIIDYGNTFQINEIRFGFNKLVEDYNASEYQDAYLYHNSSSYSLNSEITIGHYLIRNFDVSNFSLSELQGLILKFKIPQLYRLFFIEIIIHTINQNITIQQSFYEFYTDSINTGTECKIQLQGLLINTVNFATIVSDIDYFAITSYLFDFSFR